MAKRCGTTTARVAPTPAHAAVPMWVLGACPQDPAPDLPYANCSFANQPGGADDAAATCKPCPPDADCPGGAVLVPRPGGWHSAANSTFVVLCPNGEACRADDDEAQVRRLPYVMYMQRMGLGWIQAR